MGIFPIQNSWEQFAYIMIIFFVRFSLWQGFFWAVHPHIFFSMQAQVGSRNLHPIVDDWSAVGILQFSFCHSTKHLS
jgi:hypothetical protein